MTNSDDGCKTWHSSNRGELRERKPGQRREQPRSVSSISNTDDHLRNHGFIIGSAGLVLSPVFDINPNPHKTQLSLAIDEANATLSLDVAESAAQYYGLGIEHAREIIHQVRKAAQRRPEEAKALGIPARQQQLMRPAFLDAQSRSR